MGIVPDAAGPVFAALERLPGRHGGRLARERAPRPNGGRGSAVPGAGPARAVGGVAGAVSGATGGGGISRRFRADGGRAVSRWTGVQPSAAAASLVHGPFPQATRGVGGAQDHRLIRGERRGNRAEHRPVPGNRPRAGSGHECGFSGSAGEAGHIAARGSRGRGAAFRPGKPRDALRGGLAAGEPGIRRGAPLRARGRVVREAVEPSDLAGSACAQSADPGVAGSSGRVGRDERGLARRRWRLAHALERPP